MFMTTNHLSRLDSALIRPGRADVVEYIGDATPSQAGRLFLNFYGGTTSANGVEPGNVSHELRKLASQLEDLLAEEAKRGRSTSMASLQGHFIRYDASDAVKSETLTGLFHDLPVEETVVKP